MHNRILLISLASLLFLATGPVFSQTSIGSPYSRYGIGDMFVMNNTQNLSLGGAGLAWDDPGVVNYLNPASYAAMDTLAFLFDGGLGAKISQNTTSTLSQQSTYAALTHLLVGFPVYRWWKMSLGLLPYSRVGYDMGKTTMDDTLGSIANIYSGTGGINQVYLGSGFKLAKGLAFGFNAAYLFGTLSNTNSVEFPDSVYYFNYRVNTSTRVSDFLFTFGLQYHKKLGSTYRLGTGLTFSNGANIKAYETLLSETYTLNSNGSVLVKDTVQQYPEQSGELVFPYSLGFGLQLEHGSNWMILADYKLQNWENFTYMGESDSLKNSYQASLGFQIIPDSKAASSYMKKVTYRAGLHYTQTYLQLRGNRLTEAGFSLGVALPMARNRSKVNIGMEIGRKGTTEDGLLQENYIKISLSATVIERWFVRRKFE